MRLIFIFSFSFSSPQTSLAFVMKSFFSFILYSSSSPLPPSFFVFVSFYVIRFVFPSFQTLREFWYSFSRISFLHRNNAVFQMIFFSSFQLFVLFLALSLSLLILTRAHTSSVFIYFHLPHTYTTVYDCDTTPEFNVSLMTFFSRKEISFKMHASTLTYVSLTNQFKNFLLA